MGGLAASDSGQAARRARLAEPIALCAAVLLLFASIGLTTHPWFEAHADASLFVVTARSLAAGEGYTYLGAPFTLRPPGFPLLIAPLVAARGLDFHALNLLVSASGALGILALYLWLRGRLGWVVALAVAASVWLNPGYQRLCNTVMSDVPGLALLFACFAADAWAVRKPSWRRDVLLGLLLGLAGYVRTATLLLVPAIAAARLLAPGGGARVHWPERAGPAALPAGVALAVLLPWLVYAALATSGAPTDQTRLHSYVTATIREDAGDPASEPVSAAEVLGRVPQRGVQIATVLSRRGRVALTGRQSAPTDAGPESLAAGLFAALLLAALAVQLLRQRRAPEIFAAASLMLLLVYFQFGGRLVLPAYFVALAALVALLRDAAVRLLGARAGGLATVALVLVFSLADLDLRNGWARAEAGHRLRSQYFSALAARLPADARLATVRAFDYNVFLDQPTYSLHRAVRRDGVAAGVDGVLERYAIDTVVLPAEGGKRAREIAGHLEQRFGPAEMAGGARIWRVAP